MQKYNSVCILQNSIKTVVVFRIGYIKELISKGYNVYCIAPNDSDGAIEILRSNNVNVIPVSNRTFIHKWVGLNYQLLKLLFQTKFRLTVLCHFIVTFILSLPAILFTKKTVCFIEGIGTFFTERKYSLSILKFLLRKFANRRIFMNTYERNLLGLSNDTVLGGIGVDIDLFNCNQHVSDSDNTKKLLFVGRLLEDKGILDVIEVIRLLRFQNINFILNVVGDVYPSNPSSLTNDDVKNLELEFGEKIRFHGYINNVESLYAEADVLLLLSKHEGFPVVVMEANACGVPAICYSVPGCIDAIENGVNGYLFNEGEINEIADFICNKDFSLLTYSCRKYAEQNFDQITKNKTIIEVLENI